VKKKALTVDVPMPADHNIFGKQTEKISKYQELKI
jgi:hypothetical protein